MKRVGRWTWMLLTLLLLLCTTAFAETIECGSIELEQPVEVALESYDSSIHSQRQSMARV